jgi:hypothetical protein
MTYRYSISARGMGAVGIATATIALEACGGGGSNSSSAAAVAQAATGAVQIQAVTAQAATANLSAEPQFHAAPLVLAPPDDLDAVDPAGSAVMGPHLQQVTAELSQLSTRHLTHAAIESVLRDGTVPDDVSAESSGATPLSTGTVVATYTPAQIRAAYGLPSLPASGAALTPAQAAALGAGQTIYIVDAQDDPNSAAELAAFNKTFGLPTCSTARIAPGAALPLPAAGSTGCSFAVVYSTVAGGIATAAPAYNANWATEIALDVQWAHATAPLARIVLIETPDSSVSSLSAAVSLANHMGPGVVSMSFGSTEGSWTASLDATFNGASMTYVAGAGDSGAGVNWPAVSSHVLAVGGSTLTYTGTAPRSEVVWSGTGGGISQFTATPAYQTSAVPGIGNPTHRSVSDLSFNADPTTGQYVAVQAPGAAAPSWLGAGGTSVSTPQWAGIIAVANALRAQTSQSALGDPHAKLYALATQGTSYGSDFYDITHGSDGNCATCLAGIAYDQPSGIGTPNVGSLLSALAGASGSSPPLVSAATIPATVGKALSFGVSVTASDAVSFSLSGAPAGMAISATGVLTWSSPVAGTYAVTVSAKDTRTGLTGSAVCTVTVTKAGPVITAAAMSGVAGKALHGTISFVDSTSNALSISISGVPAGMSFASNGATLAATWASPVTGNYVLNVSAKDGNGASAAQSVPVMITAH